jgi:hypothetical protein
MALFYVAGVVALKYDRKWVFDHMARF